MNNATSPFGYGLTADDWKMAVIDHDGGWF